MGGRRGSKLGIQSWECVSSTLQVSSSGPAHLPLAIGEGASRLGYRQRPPLLLTLLSFSLWQTGFFARLAFARPALDRTGARSKTAKYLRLGGALQKRRLA